jgi:hypothetical protein
MHPIRDEVHQCDFVEMFGVLVSSPICDKGQTGLPRQSPWRWVHRPRGQLHQTVRPGRLVVASDLDDLDWPQAVRGRRRAQCEPGVAGAGPDGQVQVLRFVNYAAHFGGGLAPSRAATRRAR